MSTSKTIAKNTVFLYFRMLFNLGVSLYTSRIVLQRLGVEDFGTYNLVGGIVILFAFLNGSLNSATQRFINYEKASENGKNVNKIFNISLLNHVFLSLLFLLLAETIGVWFLNNMLKIPKGRLHAANIVFQFSIITTILSVLVTPFNAMILAYERMSYYAFIGIFETLAKLFIVYLLVVFDNYDQLVLYAGLTLAVKIITELVIFIYCKKEFESEVSFTAYKDWRKRKEMLSFSSWMLFGQVAVIAASQGLAMIINMFHGVIVNAALGIANQVNVAIFGFVSNFQVAFQPQIVQSYAAGEIERNKKLVLSASKYSFFLLVILSAPILFFSTNILQLWLGKKVPEYAEQFLIVILFTSLIEALSGPFWMSASAIGRIKIYNITLTIINFLTLPLAYCFLKLGFSPVYAYFTKFIIGMVLQGFRYVFINKYLKFDYKLSRSYFVGIGVVVVYIISLVVASRQHSDYSILQIIFGSVLIETFLLLLIALFGLSKHERSLSLNFIAQKFNRKIKIGY